MNKRKDVEAFLKVCEKNGLGRSFVKKHLKAAIWRRFSFVMTKPVRDMIIEDLKKTYAEEMTKSMYALHIGGK